MYFALIVFLSNTTTIYCSSSEDYSEFDNYQVNDNIQKNRPASPIFTASGDESARSAPNVQKNVNIQQAPC